MVCDETSHLMPEVARGGLDLCPIALDNLILRDIIFQPGPPAILQVQDQRLKSVDGSGKSGVFGFSSLEFFPQAQKASGVSRWQQAEYTVAGLRFLLMLCRQIHVVRVQRYVSSVDLHYVMEKQHPYHP